MEHDVPVDKLSKKQKKAYYAARRGSWNGVNPVSRKVPNKKIYDRKRAKHWRDEDALPVFLSAHEKTLYPGCKCISEVHRFMFLT